MTGTEPETGPSTEPELTDEEYHALWRELEKQFPVPTWDEVKEEWKWLRDGTANGTFDPECKYGGLAVAIYNKRVVGTDTNWLRSCASGCRGNSVFTRSRTVITSFPAA